MMVYRNAEPDLTYSEAVDSAQRDETASQQVQYLNAGQPQKPIHQVEERQKGIKNGLMICQSCWSIFRVDGQERKWCLYCGHPGITKKLECMSGGQVSVCWSLY